MGGERDIEMDAEAYALVEENMAGFGAINIRQVAGVIDQEELPRLRKLIFRGTKGKSYVYTQTIEVPEGSEEDTKSKAVYIVVYWSGNHIRDKLYKICDSFGGSRFDLPSVSEMRNEITRTKTMIAEARNVLSQTRNQIRQQLNDFDGDLEQDDDDENAPLRAKNQSIIYIYKMFLA